MTTLVVLQPSYLPWLGFFDQLARADAFVWYDDVQFDKHGWRNRNRVKGPKGPLWLTVPVRHSGRSDQLILDVEVDNRLPWRRKHRSTIEQLYAQAPFLDEILPPFVELLNQPWDRLVDLDIATTEWLAQTFCISTPRFRSSALGVGGDRNERLINFCRHFGATHYLTGDAARDYLDVPRFEAIGVEVEWHDYRHPAYPQLHGEFVPYLSALDLILNAGSAEASKILRR